MGNQTSVTQDKAIPTPLTGAIWGVSCFFNPGGHALPLDNLRRFARAARGQGLKLLIVELTLGDRSPSVSARDCDILVQKHTDCLLWHKERLLNIGVASLPPDCDKVLWLDADILFDRPDWVQETARLLDRHAVVQPFSEAVWLERGSLFAPPELPLGLGEGKTMPGMASVMADARDRRRLLADYFRHGHPGFAWGARREILTRHGLYDRHVLGGGDITIAHALYGDRDYRRGLNMACRDMTRAELESMARWAEGLDRDVRADVGFLTGRVSHLWHGSLNSRGYRNRWKILRDHAFDPRTDVGVDDQMCLVWQSDKPDLHREVRAYFTGRTVELEATGRTGELEPSQQPGKTVDA
jgi:hypothetical protein